MRKKTIKKATPKTTGASTDLKALDVALIRIREKDNIINTLSDTLTKCMEERRERDAQIKVLLDTLKTFNNLLADMKVSNVVINDVSISGVSIKGRKMNADL